MFAEHIFAKYIFMVDTCMHVVNIYIYIYIYICQVADCFEVLTYATAYVPTAHWPFPWLPRPADGPRPHSRAY